MFLSDSSQELVAAKDVNFNFCGLNRDNAVLDNELLYVNDFSRIDLEFS